MLTDEFVTAFIPLEHMNANNRRSSVERESDEEIDDGEEHGSIGGGSVNSGVSNKSSIAASSVDTKAVSNASSPSSISSKFRSKLNKLFSSQKAVSNIKGSAPVSAASAKKSASADILLEK
jgi:hypothetical protein